MFDAATPGYHVKEPLIPLGVPLDYVPGQSST